MGSAPRFNPVVKRRESVIGGVEYHLEQGGLEARAKIGRGKRSVSWMVLGGGVEPEDAEIFGKLILKAAKLAAAEPMPRTRPRKDPK